MEHVATRQRSSWEFWWLQIRQTYATLTSNLTLVIVKILLTQTHLARITVLSEFLITHIACLAFVTMELRLPITTKIRHISTNIAHLLSKLLLAVYTRLSKWLLSWTKDAFHDCSTKLIELMIHHLLIMTTTTPKKSRANTTFQLATSDVVTAPHWFI